MAQPVDFMGAAVHIEDAEKAKREAAEYKAKYDMIKAELEAKNKELDEQRNAKSASVAHSLVDNVFKKR
jgi:hypothetical protein